MMMAIVKNISNGKNKFIQLFLLLLIIVVVQLMYKSSVYANQFIPTIVWDDNNQDELYSNLDGKWLFIKEQFVSPSTITQLSHHEGESIHIPQDFLSHTGKANTFGTYVLNVSLPEYVVGSSMSIHIPYQYSAYRLYVDEQLVAENGVIGMNENDHIAEMAPKTAYFTPTSPDIHIVMHLSSFNHIRGGFENSIYLGESSLVQQKQDVQMTMNVFINGVIFIIGVFMVLFSLYRKRDHIFLIFGLFAIFVSVRSFFTVPFYYTILFPNVTWLWGTRLEYIFTILASMFYVMLMWKWHEQEFSKKVLYFLIAVHLSVLVPTLFTQPLFFQNLFFKVFYLAIPVFIYFIYVVIKSIQNNNVSAKVNLFGIAIIFIAFLNDFFIGQGWYKFWNLMLPSVALYIIMHVILMSQQFAQFVFQIERQNVQLKKLNESNKTLTSRLQQEIEQKDEFLMNTSHELRNPLHGMMNIAHSILLSKADKLDPEMEEKINLQVTIGYHMSCTIDDLVDIARLKAQQITLNTTTLNIGSVINAVIDMLNVLVGRKDVTITLEMGDDIPPIVADENRLIQILFNLLHNALKFTHEGYIIIRVYEVEGFIHIEIEDTGVGMEERVLERLFLPYEKGEPTITSPNGGIGLGLSIAKQLVELHGGTISATSTVGKGSTFLLTLPMDLEVESRSLTDEPIAPLEHEKPATRSVNFHRLFDKMIENRSDVSKANILIVDDDIVNLKVMTNVLSNSNYYIQTATSGPEALERIQAQEFDLLISDVLMPNMSGYALTREVRKTYSISELPILLLTARNNSDDIYTCFISGANDYLIKPVDATELMVRVDSLTNLQASIKERLKMEAAWLHAQIRPHFLLNTLNSIVSLSHIDTDRMIKLIEQFAHYLQSSFQFKNLDKLILLNEEIELLESYLYIQKERFGDRLQIKWELEEVEDVMIPPLTLQTLVENAVHHGVLQKSEGGTVTIRIRTVTEGIEVSVMDDGVGMDRDTLNNLLVTNSHYKEGIGLINTEQRLKRLFGLGLQIESKLNEGSTFMFLIPK